VLDKACGRNDAAVIVSWLARVAIPCALLLVATEAHAEWILDGGVGLVYESNLPRAAREADRESDVALVPVLTAGHYFQLTDAMGLTATAEIKPTFYPRFEGLTNLSATGTVAIRHKLGLGALAPWIRVFAGGGALDYGDDDRDSAIVNVGLQAGKRFSERIDLRLGYTYERLDANDTLFNGESHTVSLSGVLGLTGDLHLTVGYGFRWGDLVVHKTPVPTEPQTSRSRIVDTFDTPLTATRIDADTHLVSVTLGWAVTPHTSLGLGYEYQISIGPQFDYPNHVVRASFTYSF
jgi:hypothetical protein